MKVYIVIAYVYYETQWIEAVFSDKTIALDYIKTRNSDRKAAKADSRCVEEHTLDEPQANWRDE